MTPAQFLIDTSALARLLRPGAESFGWDQAATAELHGLTLLHHDRDFDVIARVTGQSLRWYGSE